MVVRRTSERNLPGGKKTNTENPSFRSPRRDLYSLFVY